MKKVILGMGGAFLDSGVPGVGVDGVFFPVEQRIGLGDFAHVGRGDAQAVGMTAEAFSRD